MESDISHGEEVSRKRPLEDINNNEPDTKRTHSSENMPLLKVLVPNYVAGALIGKAGSTINEIQNKFGGNIRLSANRDFYPGTVERIVVLTGDFEQIQRLNNYVMEQVENTLTNDKRTHDDGRSEQVKIVLTNGAAGLLIGRGGATIKAIQEDTKSKITITNRDSSIVHGERVLTVSGSTAQRTEGCRQIIDKIAQESSNSRNNNLKYLSSQISLNGAVGNNVLIPPPQGVSLISRPNSRYNTRVQIQMDIPDVMVGAILGKQGQTISEFIQYSGAKIKFSEKNEFAPGTMDRILTISGDMQQAETAYALVSNRAEQVHKELAVVDNL